MSEGFSPRVNGAISIPSYPIRRIARHTSSNGRFSKSSLHTACRKRYGMIEISVYPTRHRHQRETAPRQQRIHATPEPDGFVEQLKGELADVLPSQNLPVQPPGWLTDLVQMHQPHYFEPVLAQQRLQGLLIETPQMP